VGNHLGKRCTVEQGSAPAAAGKNNGTSECSDQQMLQQKLDQLQERERRIVELLNCETADRIEHKLRNLIHELQLIRVLVQRQDEEE
jgi:hypothetical protein